MPVRVGLKFIDLWNESIEKKIFEYEEEEIVKGQIVFYGPSNFTRWATYRGNTPIREALLGASGARCCINRGFGSSTTEHQLYYYPRIVRPLEPKVLVYSPGLGNALSFGYTAEETWDLATRVMSYARADFPDLKIYLCGLNLHRSKMFESKNFALEEKFEGWIREYANQNDFCTYIDVSSYEPLHRADIYEDDKVHFNNKGYVIYAELFKEALAKELAEF